MPYHGFIVYFNLKRFARLEVSTFAMNTIIAAKKSNVFKRGHKGFSSNFAFVRIFRKFLGFLVAICTVLF